MDWEKARKLVNDARQIVVLTHISPDGDAFGSMLGVVNAMRNLGKSAVGAVDGGLSAAFRFLPGAGLVRADLDGVSADLVIVTDCSDERRIGAVGKTARALGVPIINLDHHRTNTLFGDANLVDAETVASAEGVLDWLDNLDVALTPEVAQCLLCGLVTDTMCFRTNNVTAVTLGKAQRLMAAGGDLSEIVQRTVSRIPTAVIRLWAQVMPTVRIEDRVIWAKISRAAFREAGAEDGEDGGLVSLLLQAEDARIACVLREEDSNIDLSLRAVPGFDVASVAVRLGGGGHLLAAGATLPGPLDEAEARVIPLLKEAAQAVSPAAADG